MFGNIDDIASTRSMISITAGTAVDLLSIETRTLYSLSKDYPVVASRLKRHILLENLVRFNLKPYNLFLTHVFLFF